MAHHENDHKKLSRKNVLLRWGGPIAGAAFLMSTSAIGPGFLTQTSLFTQQLLTSFGFVILISILLDIGAQLNIWRIVTVSESRAQDIRKAAPAMGPPHRSKTFFRDNFL